VKSRFLTAPNTITLLRLVFVPFIVINVLDGNMAIAVILFVLAGASDALDGLLARALHQKSLIGQYLDPIADKLLLSSLFLVLSFTAYIPWRYTVLVFSRDLCILVVSAVLYATSTFRDFKPSIFGKINTVFQVAAVFFVLLAEVYELRWIAQARRIALWGTLAFTIISGVHYVILTGQRLHASTARSANSAR
jgi:cardiolipin synthase (CMP-forming)